MFCLQKTTNPYTVTLTNSVSWSPQKSVHILGFPKDNIPMLSHTQNDFNKNLTSYKTSQKLYTSNFLKDNI